MVRKQWPREQWVQGTDLIRPFQRVQLARSEDNLGRLPETLHRNLGIGRNLLVHTRLRRRHLLHLT